MIPEGTYVEREATAGVYDRTRRYDVKDGTRYASVVLAHPYTAVDAERASLGAEALRLAIEKFRDTHGPIEWSSAEVLTAYVTCQVVVELRVSPW